MIFNGKGYSAALLSLFGLASITKAITYNVITSPPNNTSVAVIVDQVVYLLEATLHGILYKGEAPSAKVGYNYAIINNANDKFVQLAEPFLRPPLQDGSSSTLNEFFNRSTSYYEVEILPQVLEPASYIHRIDSDLHIPNQIPSIHIYGNKTAIKYLHENQVEEDIDVKLSVAYIGLNDVQIFKNVEVSLAGRSSRWIPKLSYGLKLDKKGDKTLFGYKNLKLRALGNDPSYIRENICFAVIQSCGIPSTGFSYVRVFMDNQALGLFGIIETFQDPWTASEFANGDKDYESGYLYQANGFNKFAPEASISDLRYEGTDVSKYALGQYKIKAGLSKKSADSYEKLQAFTKFINESSPQTTPKNEWEKRLDVEGFLRFMTLENLLGFGDGYMTFANNYFLYEDINLAGRLAYFASDMDTTIGITFIDLSLMLSGNYSQHPGIFRRPLTKTLLKYKPYLDRYQELLLTLTKTLVNPTILNLYIDSVVAMIKTDVEWDASLPRIGKKLDPFAGLGYSTTEILDFLIQNVPEGFITANSSGSNYADRSTLPFDVAVNGPIPLNYMDSSVKGFIAKKSENILDFYK